MGPSSSNLLRPRNEDDAKDLKGSTLLQMVWEA